MNKYSGAVGAVGCTPIGVYGIPNLPRFARRILAKGFTGRGYLRREETDAELRNRIYRETGIRSVKP